MLYFNLALIATDIYTHCDFKASHLFLCRQNVSYVALEVITLIQPHTALRPTLSMNTTWPITCERTSSVLLCMYMCVLAQMKKYWHWFLFRFFLMYLINKDETEHTGQVSLKCFVQFYYQDFLWLTIHSLCLSESGLKLCPLLNCCSCVICFRSHMCGKCTRSVAGTSSPLETVSESNMKINFPSQHVFVHICLEWKWLTLNYLCSSFLAKPQHKLILSWK